jgi:hypothetical protein
LHNNNPTKNHQLPWHDPATSTPPPVAAAALLQLLASAKKKPEIICTSEENKELKWIAGFFYWVDQVQPYESDGWNYLTELKKFVHNGMVGEEFINAVSGIVNRGCHNPVSATLSMFYLLILANQSLLTMQIPCLCFSALRYRRPRWRSGTCGKFFHHPQGT